MIQAEIIEKIAHQLNEKVLDETVVTALRDQWPGIHFTYCSDDDVYQAKPVYESRNFFLYLVNNSDHCICFTSEYDKATGVVIAECENE